MDKKSFFQHPNALVESKAVGAGTRVWAFAHVLPGASVGADCNLCDHTFVENDVVLGDRVTVKCGVQLWDGLRVEDDVFIGPNVTFSNDLTPRSKRHPEAFLQTLVKKGASIGANATILPGITIGQYAMVGAGAVVTRSVPPFAVVMGNPARIVRYTDASGGRTSDVVAPQTTPSRTAEIAVTGVTLHRAPLIKDLRGNLSARQLGAGLPFEPKRYFVVLDVPSKEVRGAHAHHECAQLLTCLKGSVACVVDDGTRRAEVVLDSPDLALHMPRMVWGIQYKYTTDAVLLVLASHPYDAHDYIRDYDAFIEYRRQYDAKNGA